MPTIDSASPARYFRGMAATVIKVRFVRAGTKLVLLYGPDGKQLRSLEGVIAAWRCYRPGERIEAEWVGMEGPPA